MSAMEYDRVCPTATFETAQANGAALETDLATLEGMVGSPVPQPIASAAAACRKALKAALDDVRMVQHRQTGIGRRAA